MNRVIDGDKMYLMEEGSAVLTIEETDTDNGFLIAFDGSLKSSVAHDVLDELMAFTVLGKDIRLNFAMVTYISPGCMRVFLEVQKKMDSLGKGSLILCSLPESIMQEFDRTGTSDLLNIE